MVFALFTFSGLSCRLCDSQYQVFGLLGGPGVHWSVRSCWKHLFFIRLLHVCFWDFLLLLFFVYFKSKFPIISEPMSSQLWKGATNSTCSVHLKGFNGCTHCMGHGEFFINVSCYFNSYCKLHVLGRSYI